MKDLQLDKSPFSRSAKKLSSGFIFLCCCSLFFLAISFLCSVCMNRFKVSLESWISRLIRRWSSPSMVTLSAVGSDPFLIIDRTSCLGISICAREPKYSGSMGLLHASIPHKKLQKEMTSNLSLRALCIKRMTSWGQTSSRFSRSPLLSESSSFFLDSFAEDDSTMGSRHPRKDM